MLSAEPSPGELSQRDHAWAEYAKTYSWEGDKSKLKNTKDFGFALTHFKAKRMLQNKDSLVIEDLEGNLRSKARAHGLRMLVVTGGFCGIEAYFSQRKRKGKLFHDNIELVPEKGAPKFDIKKRDVTLSYLEALLHERLVKMILELVNEDYKGVLTIDSPTYFKDFQWDQQVDAIRRKCIPEYRICSDFLTF